MRVFRPSYRVVLIAALTLVLAGLTVHGLFAGQRPDGAFEWVYTVQAQARTAAGECFDPNASVQDVCVQLCIVTMDGHILPQDEFRCMPFF